MARAYICLVRNDLDDNLLQVLDLKPNSSQETIYQSYHGQTGYVTWAPQSDVVVTAVGVPGTTDTAAEYYGLAAYLLDNVEDNDNGNIVLTDVRANAVADGILAAITAGTALTLAAIDALIQAATGGATSGLTTAHSTGTVAEVLRICAGEAYRLPSGSAVSGAAAAFVNPHYRKGKFLASTAIGTATCVGVNVADILSIGGVVFTAGASENAVTRQFDRSGTNATTAVSLVTVINDPRNQAVIGAANGAAHRTVTAIASLAAAGSNVVNLTANQPGVFGNLALSSSNATRLPVSGTALDFTPGGYRGHRLIVDTGELHLSLLTGALSRLAVGTYLWTNPAFTYGAAGTALFVDGTHIPASGAGAAVVVYDASGNVL
jgi:hypothetical protein